MSHFGKDVMKIGPAPTMSREIPVTVANLLFTILAIAIIVAIQGGITPVAVAIAVALFAYTIGRPIAVALRGART